MSRYRGRPPAALKFRFLRYAKTKHRATITLNRPAVHNALNFEMLRELGAALEDAAWDDTIGVVVLTGAGDKAFCTGADMKEWNTEFLRRPANFYKWMTVFVETYERLRSLGKPTIARLNGMVVGGGNELQMCCDLAVAADDIFIRHVGVGRGSVPAAGATQWLPLLVGDRRAREIIYLCNEIPAKQALAWGLVNRVVPREDLDDAVDALAHQLLEKLPEVLRYTKQQLNFWRDLSWAMTIGHAKDWLTIHTGSEEVREGVRSFVEKRRPDYKRFRPGR